MGVGTTARPARTTARTARTTGAALVLAANRPIRVGMDAGGPRRVVHVRVRKHCTHVRQRRVSRCV